MNLAVLGAQWGDEGKGKIVDLLTPNFSIVARYQGGHNAGHSVYVGDKAFVLRLLPSGIIHPDKTCILGNGMVIDPKAFFEEVDQMAAQAAAKEFGGSTCGACHKAYREGDAQSGFKFKAGVI